MVDQLARQLDPGEAAALERLAGHLLAAITTDRVRHEVAWSEWSSQKEDRLMLVA